MCPLISFGDNSYILEEADIYYFNDFLKNICGMMFLGHLNTYG